MNTPLKLILFILVLHVLPGLAGLPWGTSPPGPGGLVLQLGADNASTAIGIAKTERWLVLLLASDEEQRAAFHSEIQAAGVAGMITVGLEQLPLPLADRMVNVLLLDSGTTLSQAEINRVLVPERSVVYEASGKDWTLRKDKVSMPENLAGWTHFLQDAGGTKVNQDDAFPAPDGLRFIAGPRLQDGSGANGWRIDQGIASSEWNNTMIRHQHYTEGRDAFNGVLLWQRMDGGREVRKMQAFIMGDGLILRKVPVKVEGQREASEGIAAFDPESGDLLRQYSSALLAPKGRGISVPQEFILQDGVIFQTVGKKVRALDAEKDQALWTTPHEQGARVTRPTLAADLNLLLCLEVPEQKKKLHGGGRYPAEQAQALLAFHVNDGSLAWRLPIDPDIKNLSTKFPNQSWNNKKFSADASYFHQMAYKNGNLFCVNANDANGGKPGAIWAVDVKQGKSAWVNISDMHGTYDMFPLSDGTLFVIGSGWRRYDQKSGKLLAKGGLGVNARCDTGAAAENLILAGFGNLFDVSGEELRRKRHDMARGQCGGWGTPAYGMVYHHGSGCGCYAPIRGNLAIHDAPETKPLPDSERLLKGPAYERSASQASEAGDWPVYLYNGQRRGWNPVAGPRSLKPSWKEQVAEPLSADIQGIRQDWLNTGIYNGPVTAAVVAGDLLVVSDRENRRIVGLDASTGESRWSFPVCARVLTTPSIVSGRVIFGGRDGYVYCLDARKGELLWRFLAAPEQRYLVAYGQLESVWPVHGSLPVVGDTVVASAGYHGDADGGVWSWGLDVNSGAIRWKRRLSREVNWVTLSETNKQGNPSFPRYPSQEFGDTRYSANTRIQNIDLPMWDEATVSVARIALAADSGATAENMPKDRMIYGGERFPFLDMEFEYRGGPHGNGAVGTIVHGVPFTTKSAIAQRPIHNGEDVVISRKQRNFQVVERLNKAEILKMQGRKASEIRKQELGVPKQAYSYERGFALRGADSFVAGGEVAYMALEGGEKYMYGKNQKIRMRSRKGMKVGGELVAIDLTSGTELARVELDSAVINNGLSVAHGKLYSVHEDGTIRCWE